MSPRISLSPGDVVIVDTNAIITKRGGDKVVERILETCAKVAVCDSLSEEYESRCRNGGLGPAIFLQVRLRPLSERGKLIRVPDERLVEVVPRNMDDAHLANLWATVGARIVITNDVRHAERLRQACGMPYIRLNDFLKDC